MNECIFCKIIKGDIPSLKVYEDEDFIVMLDIAPNALGHMLVVPKKHISDIFSLDMETANKLMPLVQRLSIALKETTGFDGMNILQNNGEAAGQTVMHFHMHLIPRYKNDTMKVQWDKYIGLKDETELFLDKFKIILSENL